MSAVTPRRRAWLAGLALLASASLTGCGFQGLYSVPLPGGASLGDDPFTVKAEFTDVLDIVPQAAVKVGNVPVGRVESISLADGDRTAMVTMRVNGDVRLPANATASILQTSLLGEKYVDLSSPADSSPQGTLGDGATIPLERTGEGVEVEQVFGALSLLLNGGGLEQIQTITDELGKATDGKTQQYRDLFGELDSTIGQLDARRTSITTALDSVNELAANLRADNTQIARVLSSISPGLAELESQRGQFVALLSALNNLSTVTISTLNQSQDEIVADLNNLAPVLSQLAAAGQALPQALQVLLTYPFPDSVLRAIKGDYLSGFITINFQSGVCDANPQDQSCPAPGVPGVGAANVVPADPPPGVLPATSSASPGLPSSTIVVGGSASPTASSTGSGSASPSGSSSPSGTASGSGSPSGSGTGGTPSGGTASSGTGSASPSGTTSGSASGTPSTSGSGR